MRYVSLNYHRKKLMHIPSIQNFHMILVDFLVFINLVIYLEMECGNVCEWIWIECENKCEYESDVIGVFDSIILDMIIGWSGMLGRGC